MLYFNILTTGLRLSGVSADKKYIHVIPKEFANLRIFADIYNLKCNERTNNSPQLFLILLNKFFASRFFG